jgi:hypothetical protein
MSCAAARSSSSAAVRCPSAEARCEASRRIPHSPPGRVDLPPLDAPERPADAVEPLRRAPVRLSSGPRRRAAWPGPRLRRSPNRPSPNRLNVSGVARLVRLPVPSLFVGSPGCRRYSLPGPPNIGLRADRRTQRARRARCSDSAITMPLRSRRIHPRWLKSDNALLTVSLDDPTRCASSSCVKPWVTRMAPSS